MYEAAHGAWRALPEMSAPRGYLAVARAKGASRVPAHVAASGETARASDAREPTTVLAIGGSDGERPLRSAEAFDFARGAWQTLAPMSAPRIWLGAATVGSRTFAVGGYDGSKYLDLVEAFVPGPEDAPVGSTAAQGRWVRCASLSQGRSTAGVASCGGVLYCAGGFCAPHYLSLSEAYDPAADRWWGVAPLPSARRDLGLCALESRQTLVAAGGYDGNAYLGAVDALDPRTNAWRRLAPLPSREAADRPRERGRRDLRGRGLRWARDQSRGGGVRRARGQVDGRGAHVAAAAGAGGVLRVDM